MKRRVKNDDEFHSKEFQGFLIHLSIKDEYLLYLFCNHISQNNGNLWIELDPDNYSENQSDTLYQLWDEYCKKW